MSRSRIVAVVGSPQKTNVALAEAWRRLGLRAALIDPSRATGVLRPGDVAVARLDVLPTLDGVEPGLEVLDELVARGIRVVNSSGPLLATHDKLSTARALESALIPSPRTEELRDPMQAPVISPPLVLKPRFGSWGADVFRCRTAADVSRTLQQIRTRPWFEKDGVLVQELLPPRGYDLRVLVAGGRVVGAIQRVARAGEWRTNVSLGGERRHATPSAQAADLAVKAAAAVGMEFAGVDLFPYGDAYVVLELNGAVEFDDAYALSVEDVFRTIADALDLGSACPRRGKEPQISLVRHAQ